MSSKYHKLKPMGKWCYLEGERGSSLYFHNFTLNSHREK